MPNVPTIVAPYGLLGSNSIESMISGYPVDYIRPNQQLVGTSGLVNVNLTKVRGVNAVGLLGLTMILTRIIRSNCIVHVQGPYDAPTDKVIKESKLIKTVDYLSSLMTYKNLDEDNSNSIIWNSPERGVTEWDAPETPGLLMHISNQKDGEKLCSIAVQLQQVLNYSADEIYSFTEVISELCDNICNHSLSAIGGIASIHVQTKTQKRPSVLIAIGDLGIGVRESLVRSNRLANHYDDMMAVSKALNEGVSRYSAPGRGGGLQLCKRHAIKYGYYLAVRSGRAYLVLGHSPKDTNWFPGTFVYFGLRLE